MDYLISIGQKDPDKASQLFHYLHQLLDRLDRLGVVSSLGERIIGDRFLYLLSCRLGRRTQEKEVRLEIGQTMAQFIHEYEEPEILKELVQKESRSHMQEDLDEIFRISQLQLQKVRKGSRSSVAKRQERLANQITLFLRESRSLAIDGYIRFRMKQYRDLLAPYVKEAVDEYILDKEYQDFIQLLKYFVSVQTSKIEIVHLIHEKKRTFQLLDVEGIPLQLKELDGALNDMMEQSFSHEDLIVSTLLTIAPEKVILHTRFPDENVIRTLLQIFEGRIMICRGCSECGFPLDLSAELMD